MPTPERTGGSVPYDHTTEFTLPGGAPITIEFHQHPPETGELVAYRIPEDVWDALTPLDQAWLQLVTLEHMYGFNDGRKAGQASQFL
jgi:hypothetical protein